MTAPLSSADITIFFTRNQQLLLYQKADIDCILTRNSFLLTLFESLKVVLINMVAILIMSAKLATLGLLKIKLLWNKGYDVIISVHYVISKILSRDSNYIVDVILRSKFCNSARPILDSKGMRAIFQKKGKSRAKKILNRAQKGKYWKVWAKMYKIWKYFQKGQGIACDYRTQ